MGVADSRASVDIRSCCLCLGLPELTMISRLLFYYTHIKTSARNRRIFFRHNEKEADSTAKAVCTIADAAQGAHKARHHARVCAQCACVMQSTSLPTEWYGRVRCAYVPRPIRHALMSVRARYFDTPCLPTAKSRAF